MPSIHFTCCGLYVLYCTNRLHSEQNGEKLNNDKGSVWGIYDTIQPKGRVKEEGEKEEDEEEEGVIVQKKQKK